MALKYYNVHIVSILLARMLSHDAKLHVSNEGEGIGVIPHKLGIGQGAYNSLNAFGLQQDIPIRHTELHGKHLSIPLYKYDQERYKDYIIKHVNE